MMWPQRRPRGLKPPSRKRQRQLGRRRSPILRCKRASRLAAKHAVPPPSRTCTRICTRGLCRNRGTCTSFTPGDSLQRLNEHDWNVGVTRYFNQRLGVTVDGRGTYGSAYLNVSQAQGTGVFKPAISQYAAMIGPYTYRFYSCSRNTRSQWPCDGRSRIWQLYRRPWAMSPARAIRTLFQRRFSGSEEKAPAFRLEYNVSPRVGLRVAPEYVLTTYGSTIQNSLGFTAGLVVRWGRQ